MLNWQEILTIDKPDEKKRLEWVAQINDASNLNGLLDYISQSFPPNADKIAKQNIVMKHSRKLYLLFHPDKFTTTDKKAINDAFQIIKDRITQRTGGIANLIPGIDLEMLQNCLNKGKPLIHAWSRQYWVLGDRNAPIQWFQSIAREDGITALDCNGNTFLHESLLWLEWIQPFSTIPNSLEYALNYCAQKHKELLNQHNSKRETPADSLLSALWNSWIKKYNNQENKSNLELKAAPLQWISYAVELCYMPMLYGMDPTATNICEQLTKEYQQLCRNAKINTKDDFKSVFLCAMVEMLEYKNYTLSQAAPTQQTETHNTLITSDDIKPPVSKRTVAEQIKAYQELINSIKNNKYYPNLEQRRALSSIKSYDFPIVSAACLLLSTTLLSALNFNASVAISWGIGVTMSLALGVLYVKALLSYTCNTTLRAYRNEDKQYSKYCEIIDKAQTPLTVKAVLIGIATGLIGFTILQWAHELALCYGFPGVYCVPLSIEAYFNRGSYFEVLSGVAESDIMNYGAMYSLGIVIAMSVIAYLGSKAAIAAIYAEPARMERLA